METFREEDVPLMVRLRLGPSEDISNIFVLGPAKPDCWKSRRRCERRGWSEGAMCVELEVLRGQVVCLYWKWAAGA